VNGIAEDHFVRAVREDPVRPGLLYAATEETVYVSWNDGGDWQPLTMNLPVVQVSDLVVKENDLVIGTHGRSFWVMENIELLRQLPDRLGDEVILYDPDNPVRGFDNSVEVFYWLAEDAEEVTMDFIDASGNAIQSFTSVREDDDDDDGGWGRTPRLRDRAGVHRFRWNMRHAAWRDFEGRIFWAAAPTGPEALPGDYTVRLTVDGEVLESDFEIEMNPRAAAEGVTMADLQARFDFAMQLRDKVTEANEAVIRIRDIESQVADRMEAAENAELEALAGEVGRKLDGVEQEIYQVRNQSSQDPLNFPIKLNNKIAALLNLVEGSEYRPTAQSYDVFDKLDGELNAELESLTVIIQQDVARLNELLRELGLEPINTERLIT
jgi:hypothetical protein